MDLLINPGFDVDTQCKVEPFSYSYMLLCFGLLLKFLLNFYLNKMKGFCSYAQRIFYFLFLLLSPDSAGDEGLQYFKDLIIYFRNKLNALQTMIQHIWSLCGGFDMKSVLTILPKSKERPQL